MGADRRPRATPWRDPLPKPGPVVVFDIDGVVATMTKFEPLLGDRFDMDAWNAFQKRYKHAALISRGARLADDAIEAGLQIVWSTTRPDHVAGDTWQWLTQHKLPTGPIMTRHRIKDGTRPAVEVKLRHWYWWNGKHGEDNPIVAWVDANDDANAALPWNGCPTWRPKTLQRALVRNRDKSMFDIVTSQGRYDKATLEANFANHRPAWDQRDEEFQRKRSRWWQAEKERRQQKRDQARPRPSTDPIGLPTEPDL